MKSLPVLLLLCAPALAAPSPAPAPAGRRISVDGRTVEWGRTPLGKKRTREVIAFEGKILVDEPSGPVGDGERVVHFSVDERGIFRWQSSPTVARCDGATALFRERWDFVAERFVPVEGEVPEGTPLAATRAAPPGLAPRPLGLFQFVAASSSRDDEGRADRLAAPRELADGVAATTWSGERGAWVTARAQSALRVRALRIEPVGAGPRALTVVGGGRFTATVPPGKGPFFIALDTTPTACLSLVLDEATTLGEVAIYTEADGAEGLDRLAAELADGGPASEAAERALASHGAGAARALERVLQKGARHSLRVLRALASIGVPEAAAPLGRALETASGDERSVVIDGLVKLGGPGAAEAARVYRDKLQAPAARADAAQVLGRTGSVAPLVEGVGRGEAEVRAATMAALLGAGAAEPLLSVLQKEPLCGAEVEAARLGDLARLVGQLARGSTLAAAAAEKLVEAARCSTAFALRLRLLRALGALGDPSAAPFLDETAQRERDELLRFTAVQAAGALDGQAGRATVERAVGDADPRVRKTALLALAAQKAGGPALARALETDRWPLVRRAAAEGLGSVCGAAGPLEKALGDEAEEVRLASLVSLGRCGNLSHPLLARVLLDEKQPRAVRELAAALLARGEYPQASRTLAEALLQVLDNPAADERGAHLALSILRALARRCDKSKEVRAALERAAEDPEPSIQRAGRQTLDRCR